MPLSNETFIIILRGDIDFSRKQRQAIEEASHEWYQFTRGKFLFHIIYDLDKTDIDAPRTDDLIFKINSQFHHAQKWDEKYSISGCGWCTREKNRGNIYIVEDRIHNYDYFKTTIMHELGHYVGLEHTPKSSIMYAHSSQQNKFTELDGIELCDRYGYQLSDLDYHPIIT